MILGDVNFFRKLLRHHHADVAQQRLALGDRGEVGGETHEEGGVPAKPVDAVFLDPHTGVVANVLAHLGAAVVGTWTPCGRVPGIILIKIDAAAGRAGPAVKLPQRVAEVVGSVVVVHDVEQHRDAPRMTRVDKTFQSVGSAIGALHSKRVGRIIPPAVVAGEFGDRHELHRVRPQRSDMVEAGGRAIKRAAKRPNMHFVHDKLVARRRGEFRCGPAIRRRVDNNRRGLAGMDHLPGARIAPAKLVVDGKLVFMAGARGGHIHRPHPVARRRLTCQRQRVGRPPIKRTKYMHAGRIRRPHPKGDASTGNIGIRYRSPPGALGNRQTGWTTPSRRQ